MFTVHPYFSAVFLVASLSHRPGLLACLIVDEANKLSEPSAALERNSDPIASILLEQGQPTEVQCPYSLSIQLHQLQYMYLPT